MSEQSLVIFIRKRDPRYKAYLKAQSQPPVMSSQLRNLPAQEADVEPTAVYVEQEWQKTIVSGIDDLEWALAEGNGDPEVFECVSCGKSFKSEAAWNSHERSKKHMKNVDVIRRQMAEEAIQLGLPVNPSDESGPELAESSKQSEGSAPLPMGDKLNKEHEIRINTEEPPESPAVEEALPEEANDTEPIPPQEQKPSKRDKRRLREVKKQAQLIEDAHVSNWCGNTEIILTIGHRNAMFARQNSRADPGCSITSGGRATQLQDRSQRRVQNQRKKKEKKTVEEVANR